MEMFMSQSWFAICGEIVVIANAITMALPDRVAVKIPILGKLFPIINWLALNVFNNINAPKGMQSASEAEAEIDAAKAKVRERNDLPDVLEGL